MQKISGQEISESIINHLKAFKLPKKIFAVFLVGEDPISVNFIKQKEEACGRLGIDFRLYSFSESKTNDELRREIGDIVKQSSVGGAVIQLPLPRKVNKQYVLNVLPKEKDLDVLGERALGAFYAGRSLVLPPAVGVIERLVEEYKINLEVSNVVVVGLGSLIGKPISVWLMGKVKILNLVDSRGDIDIIRSADLIISGAGKASIIDPGILRKGASVIDFGYDYLDGKLRGDLDISDPSRLKHLNAYTPTPGGTGPILVAKLLENFYKLNDEIL
ncbi:MAG TPA: bifunctional 5,10-methylenetetrahydrofolate dehydrogenase/5,10-methenyltetrahydrofolate cyclohydrolase [Candidatus Paceibacterota bacterium]